MNIVIDEIKTTKDVIKNDVFEIGDVLKYTYKLEDLTEITGYGIITKVNDTSIEIVKATKAYTKGYNEKTLKLEFLLTCTAIEILNKAEEE